MPRRVNKKEYNAFSRMREMISILRKHDVIHGIDPEKLRLILDDLGPTFVKIGQLMSMRSDVLPVEYCEELGKLRNAVVAMPIQEVKKILLEEYGEGWGEIFREISPKPLGAASIAQVHSARLGDGRKVALKIQRPRVRERMAEDIRIFKRAIKIMNVITKIGDYLDFNMLLDEMWEAAQKELDFLAEAAHIEQFQKLNENIEYVSCPTVISEHSTTRILVMDFVWGIPIDETERLVEAGYDVTEIGKKFACNYIKQVLEDGFFHADPHPGNIRICEGKIVWLDLGMMGRVSARDRDLFNRAVLAIANGNVYELERALLAIGIREAPVSHSELYEDIDMFLMKYGNANLTEIEFSKVLSDLMDVAGRHHIAMPPGITMLSRGLMTMESVLAICCPESSFVEILTSHYYKQTTSHKDIEKEIATAYSKFANVAAKSAEIPGYFSDILEMAVRGQAKLNLSLYGSEENQRRATENTNRLIMGLIDGALILGSSIICLSDIQPQILGMPVSALVGFGAAILLSSWLILSCRRSVKKKQ